MLRYEKKYLVPIAMMDRIRSRMSSFVRPDIYTHTAENGIRQYTVRSIYFDTHNMEFYNEKIEGLIHRRKLRIRAYDKLEAGCRVVFEIKRKIENRIKKHRSFVPYDNVNKILASGDIEKYIVNESHCPKAVEDAQRFLYHIKKSQLIPTCLIVYEREAYHGKFDPGVRITFDKNIRSLNHPGIDQLFEDDNMTYLFDNQFILEIKYFTDQMPMWARSLVQEFRLRNDALSKYTIGFQACDIRKKIVH
jgi:SPX domain protein involved in polyphosphate accumulation